MQLPTMSLRVAKEHQQLIRDIGLALRTRPELVYVLRDVLQSQHSSALRDTDVLQSIRDPIRDRIAALEEREPRMVRMEALEARIAALENQSMLSGAPSPPDEAEPTQPHLTIEQTRQIDAMMKAGKSASEI